MVYCLSNSYCDKLKCTKIAGAKYSPDYSQIFFWSLAEGAGLHRKKITSNFFSLGTGPYAGYEWATAPSSATLVHVQLCFEKIINKRKSERPPPALLPFLVLVHLCWRPLKLVLSAQEVMKIDLDDGKKCEFSRLELTAFFYQNRAYQLPKIVRLFFISSCAKSLVSDAKKSNIESEKTGYVQDEKPSAFFSRKNNCYMSIEIKTISCAELMFYFSTGNWPPYCFS